MNKVTQSIYKNTIDKHLFTDDGDPRFIFENGEASNAAGMTVIYNKWCLNANHLFLEVAGYFEGISSIPSLTLLTHFEMPQWILNKIVDNIEQGVINLVNYNLASTTIYENGHALIFKTPSGISISQFDMVDMAKFNGSRVNFRITYDMIIDI